MEMDTMSKTERRERERQRRTWTESSATSSSKKSSTASCRVPLFPLPPPMSPSSTGGGSASTALRNPTSLSSSPLTTVLPPPHSPLSSHTSLTSPSSISSHPRQRRNGFSRSVPALRRLVLSQVENSLTPRSPNLSFPSAFSLYLMPSPHYSRHHPIYYTPLFPLAPLFSLSSKPRLALFFTHVSCEFEPLDDASGVVDHFRTEVSKFEEVGLVF